MNHSAAASSSSSSSSGPDVLLTVKILGTDNIKVLSAILNLLQKIGKELIIEFENGVMTFRSLNDPKSAFISVEFDRDYFEEFFTAENAENFSCKVTIKVILTAAVTVLCY